MIYGVGTISGDRLKHPFYAADGNYNIAKEDKVTEFTPWKTFSIFATNNIVVEGVCVSNPAFHTMQIRAEKPGKGNSFEPQTFARWIKIIAWRANGDGIGATHVVEDSFLRTVDDSAYVKGDMRRVIFWKDHGAIFHMANTPRNPLVIEDCEVICLGTRSTAVVFNQRGSGASGVSKVNLHVRNFQLTDTNPKGSMFALSSGDKGGSLNGIVFENITIAAECTKGGKNMIKGVKNAPWDGAITFKNLVIGGKKIMNLDSFKTNEYVKNIKFEK
jgi:polygalacturonase